MESLSVKDDTLTEEQVAALTPIDFVTLGMFIIDEIEFLPPTPPVKDILGGAGTYSALGARLFSPPPQSTSVGWIIDQGTDFPPALTTLIDSWQTSPLLRKDPERLTTRGWNGYVETGNTSRRAFKYVTPKKRLTAADLTPELLLAKSFHLICSPGRCRELVTDITASRKAICPPELYQKPIFIWEPVPDLCTPDELLNCTNTLPLVDICSPNHSELAGFMGDDGIDPETGEISTVAVERACEQLLASMPLQSFTLVVRAGEKGCYIARNGGRKRQTAKGGGGSGAKGKEGEGPKRRKKDYTRGGLRPDTDMEALFAGLLQDEEGVIAREEIEVDPGVEHWVPAVHQDASKVVDPTGGGNTFLGGLAVALARGKCIDEAVAWGSVAASLAIEQVGVPKLEIVRGETGEDEGDKEAEDGGKNDDGEVAVQKETWNGVSVQERLDEFMERIKK